MEPTGNEAYSAQVAGLTQHFMESAEQLATRSRVLHVNLPPTVSPVHIANVAAGLSLEIEALTSQCTASLREVARAAAERDLSRRRQPAQVRVQRRDRRKQA